MHPGYGGLQRRMTKFIWDSSPKQVVEVLTPTNRHGGGSERIFEDESPTYNPGYELAHRCVSVSVGAAGNRDHGCEFGITEARKSASDGRNNEGYGDCGS